MVDGRVGHHGDKVMNDDRLRRESTREIFEAIVGELDDPELVRSRRLLLLLGVGVVVLAVALTAIGAVSWLSLVAFCSTFLPGLRLARFFLNRQFAASQHVALRAPD
jgi:hypothetical protein